MLEDNIVKILEQQLIRLLKCDILPSGSYLAGGTAVYFYLNHRISVDLDFFTPKNFNAEIFISSVKTCFNDVYVELMEKNTIILYLSKEKIKFSLFLFPYKLLVKTQSFALPNDIICPMASLEDIEAMKAVAVAQRGSVKDFIDLYFILKKTDHFFNDILKAVEKKYEVKGGYEYQLRTSLVYFDDAEKDVENIIMVREHHRNEKITKKEWEEIKGFFKEFVK